jgi:hypothetical protein
MRILRRNQDENYRDNSDPMSDQRMHEVEEYGVPVGLIIGGILWLGSVVERDLTYPALASLSASATLALYGTCADFARQLRKVGCRKIARPVPEPSSA